MNKYKKFKKQFEKNQQTFKSFDRFYRRSFQDDVIDKREDESLCKNFTKYVEETKNQSFL